VALIASYSFVFQQIKNIYNKKECRNVSPPPFIIRLLSLNAAFGGYKKCGKGFDFTVLQL
jgi:hypothetical protein